MNPYNVHNAIETSSLVLIVAFAAACGAPDASVDDGRDESFLALMGSDGRADSILLTESSPEAQAVLQVVNTLPYRDLQIAVGLDERAVGNIVAHRDRDALNPADDNLFGTLSELDATPWVGLRAFKRLYSFADDNGYIELLRHPVTCAVDADCKTGVCHADHCFDVTTVTLPATAIQALEVSADGSWWARSHAGGTTVREMRGGDVVDEVNTQTFADPDIASWLPRLPDGSLTAVTRSCNEIVPEFGGKMTLNSLNLPLDAAYDNDGSLFVVAQARDIYGTPHGVVVLRQSERGWFEEFKFAFDGARALGETLTARFTRAQDGSLQIWTDIDTAARRFDRVAEGRWREGMSVDMSGFGARAADRDVEFLQATDGTVFMHRQAWTFMRAHDAVRIDGDAVTGVTGLPTMARRVAAHPNGDLTIVYADGSLSRFRDGVELRGTAAVATEVDDDALLRVAGEDIYYLQGDSLTILRAR